ncbi:MAG: LysR substrate-binding domain-containing protein [Chloroflexota bacterium]
MNLSYLRTFVTVIDQGGFSAAARALGISQPAATQQLQRLEEALNTRLIERDRRGIAELTVCGKAVLAFARTTVTTYDTLLDELERLRNSVEGRLYLAASTVPGEYLVPRLVAEFRAQYPAVEALVTVSDTKDVVNRVINGECDIGFIGAPLRRPGLTLERLASDTVVLAVYADHPFLDQESVTWEQVVVQPLIMREEGSGTRQTVLQALAAQGLELPLQNVALTLGSTQAVVQAIQDRLGIGFVSQRAISRTPAIEQLPTVTINGLDLGRELFVIYEQSHITTPLLRTFLDFSRTQSQLGLRCKDTESGIL